MTPVRYRLRTLLIVLALGPLVLAGMWHCRSAIVNIPHQVQKLPVFFLIGCITIEFIGVLTLVAIIRALQAIERTIMR